MNNTESHINNIKIKGFTIIKNFLKKKEVNKYLKLIEIYYKKNKVRKYSGVPNRDKTDKILYNLQNKDFNFIKLITSKKTLEIAKYFLNDPYYKFLPPHRPNFILKYFNARSSGSELDLHIDTCMPFKGNRTYMMQFVFLLEKSNFSNGCTKVVPGSHISGNYCDRNTKKLLYLEGNPGDLIIWDSRLWHGTTENKINKSRWAIICTFSNWFIKQSMDIPKGLPKNIYKKCNNLQKQILGFCSIPPINENLRINTKSGYNILKK